jgi:transposase InsO family protein
MSWIGCLNRPYARAYLSARSDNPSEFTAKAVKGWLGGLGIASLYLEPGGPWENGYLQPLIVKLSDDLLNCDFFGTLLEAVVPRGGRLLQ